MLRLVIWHMLPTFRTNVLLFSGSKYKTTKETHACLNYSSIMKMEIVHSSEISLNIQSTRDNPKVLQGFSSEWCTSTNQQLQHIESSEMKFLKSAPCYRRMKKKTTNKQNKTTTTTTTDIIEQLNIFNLWEKVKEYQQNYSEYIVTNMTINRQRFGKHLLKAGILEREWKSW
jgi:hypothetical protein